ncbi:MAG: YcxB family protein [Lachnospiraceae bacterium]
MDKEIRFDIQLTAKDLWQFSMYHTNNGLRGGFNIIFTLAALYLLVVRWAGMGVSNRLLMICCALMFTVIQPLMMFLKARRQVKTPAMQQPMVLVFGEKGLHVEMGGQDIDFEWDQMGRMDKKPTQIILYMDRIHAYLIPNSELAGKEEDFFEMIRTHLPKERRRNI